MENEDIKKSYPDSAKQMSNSFETISDKIHTSNYPASHEAIHNNRGAVMCPSPINPYNS